MNLPQDGIKLHRGNFTAIGRQIQPYLEDGKCFRMVLKPWRERRSLSQNALSHMWYSEISEYLISRGKTFATPAWVHIKAVCQSVREATTASGVDNAASPRLADTAERDYFTLRERLVMMQAQLEGAQQYITEQCLK